MYMKMKKVVDSLYQYESDFFDFEEVIIDDILKSLSNEYS